MKVYRMGINKICMELNDDEARDLALLMDRGLDDLYEYNEISLLEENPVSRYKDILMILKAMGDYR